ncbi:serine hydrolase [Streptomyces sp. NBC_00455]|uniref:serine hydrolase n=1 Tax=Streptomyces sp. NBC_00455 TaxID=2903654 RepID=UPI002E1E97D4
MTGLFVPVDHVVALGRAHLTPGALLADPAVMRQPQVELPNPHGGGRHGGIGWSLDEWDGQQVVSHSGDTIGQHAALWALPEFGTTVAVLINGGRSVEFQHHLVSELLHGLHGVRVPTPLAPPDRPVYVEVEPLTGVYERAGSRIHVTSRNGRLSLAMLDPTRSPSSTPREITSLLTAIWQDRAGPAEACAEVRGANDPGRSPSSTPRQVTGLLAAIWRNEAGTAQACAEVRDIMSRQVLQHRLVSGFPDGVRTAGKTGTDFAVRNEAGVVEYPDNKRYAVGVFLRTGSPATRQPLVDRAIGEAARAAVGHLRSQP